ncbi:hypothetical protein [Alkalihalobacillus sp. TS-13]|uniref:hypothetical protein n=1 Tax=Alkalihalobacillus sp. TS-13 TaxID=2842455 RepID=UPI001C86F557|nr:hypothetical protein [Alkalihalobacillus sp. TS-13]
MGRFLKNNLKDKRDKHYQVSDDKQPILSTLENNFNKIMEALSANDDFAVKLLRFNDGPCKLLYFDTLIDIQIVQSKIIEPILEMKSGEVTSTIPIRTIKPRDNVQRSLHASSHERILCFIDGNR